KPRIIRIFEEKTRRSSVERPAQEKPCREAREPRREGIRGAEEAESGHGVNATLHACQPRRDPAEHDRPERYQMHDRRPLFAQDARKARDRRESLAELAPPAIRLESDDARAFGFDGGAMRPHAADHDRLKARLARR